MEVNRKPCHLNLLFVVKIIFSQTGRLRAMKTWRTAYFFSSEALFKSEEPILHRANILCNKLTDMTEASQKYILLTLLAEKSCVDLTSFSCFFFVRQASYPWNTHPNRESFTNEPNRPEGNGFYQATSYAPTVPSVGLAFEFPI